MNNTFLFILCSVFLVTFGKASAKEDMRKTKPMPVYNQAYQADHEADKIANILREARYAYVLLDPFDKNVVKHVSAIKRYNNEVGAYISIGTGEKYRADFSRMRPSLVEKAWKAWPDEYFVNIISETLINIIKARIDKIASWGFDWVELDNMDWFYDDEARANYGFEVTEAEGIDYYQEICGYVHAKGMKCMAKNTVKGALNFDGVLYESFADNKNWWDKAGAKRFLDSGKLVIINHYGEKNCIDTYNYYKRLYGGGISFICEDVGLKRYMHFNQ